MSGRRPAQTRKRSEHLDLVSEPVEVKYEVKQVRKRQRRLTAHHRGAAAATKAIALTKGDPSRTRKTKETGVTSARASAAARQKAELAATRNQSDPALAAPQAVQCPSSSSDEENEIDNLPAGYVSVGVSVKMAPGKRIRWRGAILEDDIVRQNLTGKFMRAIAMTRANTANGFTTKMQRL